jgi:hypothetical protein
MMTAATGIGPCATPTTIGRESPIASIIIVNYASELALTLSSCTCQLLQVALPCFSFHWA